MVDTILEQRGKRYGDFEEQCEITNNIKQAYRNSPNWHKLPPYMKEALDMEATKNARILNGDFSYEDNWRDKEGYSRLVADICKG